MSITALDYNGQLPKNYDFYFFIFSQRDSWFCTVYALNAFKEAIYEDPLLAMSNWNVLDADPCDWNGISCSIARDHVLKL